MDDYKYFLARDNMWAATRAMGLVNKKDIADFAGLAASRVSELKSNSIHWTSLNRIIAAIVKSGKGKYTEQWFFVDHNKPTIDKDLITEVKELKEIVLRMEQSIEKLKK